MGLIGGLVTGARVRRWHGIPFVDEQNIWSIGIYTGESPFNLVPLMNSHSPVLTAKQVTDVSADFVADPFMIQKDSTWYMFFEVMNARTKGNIGLATSQNGLNWNYQQIVLNEPFHLSYPHVFDWQGQYYMVPESRAAGSIRLYQASNFPTQWSFVAALLYGDYVDPSIFHHEGHWWLFAGDKGTNATKCDTLRLFYTDNLIGPWTEHPKSPIITRDASRARPGGRVLRYDNRIFRFAQDCEHYYGIQVRAFEIIELSTVSYKEQEMTNPILKASGKGWNRKGMHHIDLHQIGDSRFLAAVDGHKTVMVFGLGH